MDQQPTVRVHVDHIGSSKEYSVIKDFTPKAVLKAQYIIKDRLKTGIQNKGKVKLSLENYYILLKVLFVFAPGTM